MLKNSPDFEYSVFIEENHPATDGHFIGNPILPGVVIIEHVRIAFELYRSGMHLKRLNKVKNIHPLKPGRSLIVKLSAKNENNFNFSCFDSDNNQIAVGDFYAEYYQAVDPVSEVESVELV